jgi:hypothetical protein
LEDYNDDGRVDSSADLPVKDLYTDWVKTEFGPDAPQALIDMFIKYDGGPRTRTRDQWFANLPRISNWNGPGAIFPQRRSWEMVVSKEFAFVGEMEIMRSSIAGLGALERYDYWLNTFRFQREMGHLSCLRGELDEIIESIESEKKADNKQERVIKEALPLRIAIARSWEQMMAHMLQTVTNSSELGTIANLEMHTRKNTHFVSLHDSQVQQWLGSSLPADARLSNTYTGTPYIIVPSKRTRANVGENLHLKVIILDNNRVKEAKLYWRKLGDKDYQEIVLKHVARAVYKVSFPKFEEEKTIEYHVKAQTASAKELIWPATAPAINHSVIIMNE